MRCSGRSESPTDRGQAVVELALSLPLVFVLLLGVVQVGLVVRDHLHVTHLAREAARAAAVSDHPAQAAARAVAAAGGASVGAGASVTTGGGTVTATVTGTSRTVVPLVGALLPDIALRSSVTMAVEPP